jgi:hypothetical protein
MNSRISQQNTHLSARTGAECRQVVVLPAKTCQFRSHQNGILK